MRQIFEENPILKTFYEKKKILFFHEAEEELSNWNLQDPINIKKAILQIPGKKIKSVNTGCMLTPEVQEKIRVFLEEEIKDIFLMSNKQIEAIIEHLENHGEFYKNNQDQKENDLKTLNNYSTMNTNNWRDTIQGSLPQSRLSPVKIGDFFITFNDTCSMDQIFKDLLKDYQSVLDSTTQEEFNNLRNKLELAQSQFDYKGQVQQHFSALQQGFNQKLKELQENIAARYAQQIVPQHHIKAGLQNLIVGGAGLALRLTPVVTAVGVEMAGGATLGAALTTAGIGLNLATGGIIMLAGAGLYGGCQFVKGAWNWWHSGNAPKPANN